LAARHDLWILSDEIYARILFSGAYKSIWALPGMAERTVIIDGFSKSFAMTGWRLGYAVAPKHVIDAMDLLVLNTFTCVAEFTQVAAIEALHDSTNAVDAMVAEYRKRRDQFVAGLNSIPGFRCQPPDGAFYAWVNIEETGLSAEEVQKLLLEEAGVAGIAGEAFGAAGRNYLRFSLVSARNLLEDALERMQRVSAHWRAAVSR
jgi:aspartate aminotransferase